MNFAQPFAWHTSRASISSRHARTYNQQLYMRENQVHTQDLLFRQLRVHVNNGPVRPDDLTKVQD